MGLSLSCPFAILSDLDQSLFSVIEKSTYIRDDEQKTPVDCRCKEVACLPSRSYRENEVVPNKCDPQHEAAIKLQKVYKSDRTRRKLADCAVLIEQNWWKLLDFVELKHSSISFFDTDKHETAISRWSRARTKAAKVGKGYGHNLHFYYTKWQRTLLLLLDIGEGRDINVVDKCPRSKLQQQCIKYLGPMERRAYRVAMEDGKLFYKQSGEYLDTTGAPKGSKWIFVLSTAKAVWPHSGHYRPTPENFQDLTSFLRENYVDLTDVKLDAIDDDEEESVCVKDVTYLRSNSEDDLTEKDCPEGDISSTEKATPDAWEVTRSKLSRIFRKGSSGLEIQTKVRLLERRRREIYANEHYSSIIMDESLSDGDETAEESFSVDEHSNNCEQDELKETKTEIISGECVLQRIISHKGMESFQLGRQLSCKWSTGAGPRIGCVRDYPTGLQSHALEQVNLSLRTIHCLRPDIFFRSSTPSRFSYERRHPFGLIATIEHSLLHFVKGFKQCHLLTCLDSL
ncbi:hypothetical protein Leryth_003902 [Lithospermum erythrorhizon]|nr:hypothetical protein Leryth_003902 [Lithospermum erythrorhizon]